VRIHTWTIALTVLATVTLAGCTSTSAGTPRPDPASPTENTSDEPASDTNEPPSGSDDLPSDGAPKVANPFDASHFEQNPCDALTQEQLKELNVGKGKPLSTNFGKGCSWRNPETGGSVAMDWASTDKRGLSSAYRSNNNDELSYFEPIADIQGHPAVAYDINSSNPTAACFVGVGITDELLFSSRVVLSGKNLGVKNPCEMSALAAGMMLETMRGES
jgi:hypothetical protein